jgi:hypothetical protein
MELTNLSGGNSVCMTECLVAARAVIVLWTSLAVMPAEIVFDASAVASSYEGSV